MSPFAGSVARHDETERGTEVKKRRGWYIVWPDGTKWLEDCAKAVREPIMPGAKRVPIQIMGSGRAHCDGCASGKH